MTPTAAQTRVIDAALALFAEHGVNGTSLQMIADALGVTKAAVYHQFPAKDDIVLAVMEAELGQLQAAVELADAEPDRARGLDQLVARVVDIAVARRGVVGALQNDPVVVRLMLGHEPFPQLFARLDHLLAGPEPTSEERVAGAMFLSAVGGTVSHPLVSDLDDDALRDQLLEVSRRLLGLPTTP